MDTTEAAERIGTTPRILRQFLRSGLSTFVPVGSGARYEFSEKDVDTLTKRFYTWRSEGKPQVKTSRKKTESKPDRIAKRRARDQQEWAEEGPVVLQDIRDPRVRARVRADAAAAERRLEERLMAAGLHLFQLGDHREKKSA